MNISLYEAAAAMNANMRWQETISENLGASSIPGFKKQELSFNSIQAGLISPSTAVPLGMPGRYTLPSVSAATNFRQGELKPTGAPTDLAIEGPGFFEVQLPNGSRAFTRDGELHLKAQGQLATKEGCLVMSDAGPLQFDLNSGAPIAVSLTGEVSQGGDKKGTLKLVEFNDRRLLTPVGGGLFQATDPNLIAQNPTQSSLRQRFLESANTSTVTEMGDLITALRLFEANQRVIQAQDERLGRLVNDLGNPS